MLQKQIKKISRLRSTDLIKIRADISTLVTSKIDRKIFDQELQKEQDFQQNKLNQIQTSVDNQLQSIRKELKKLENRMASLQKVAQPPLQKPLSPTPPKDSSGSTGTQPGETATPKSGQIIEKDI
jgi:hypothetical protein